MKLKKITIVILTSCLTLNFLHSNNKKKLVTDPPIVVEEIQPKDAIYSVKIFLKLLTEQLLSSALSYLGTPFRFGGESRKGLDCSSFVMKTYRSININLPRTSWMQAKEGTRIDPSNLEKGDLLFFSPSPKSKISHVAIVYDKDKNGDILFIHSASSIGVSIANLKNSYWKKRFRYGKRVLSEEKINQEFISTMKDTYSDLSLTTS